MYQRKASMLNQASYHLPVRIAQETFYQYEIDRLELTLDNAKHNSTLNLPKILQIKSILNTARTTMKEVQQDKEFFATNPPKVPDSLWNDLPAILREASLLEGQAIVLPQ